MKSKTIFLHLSLILLTLFIPLAYSAEEKIGCCVLPTACMLDTLPSDCNTFYGSYFVENKTMCQDQPPCTVGCCKYGLTRPEYLITQKVTCDQFIQNEQSEWRAFNPPNNFGRPEVLAVDEANLLFCRQTFGTPTQTCLYQFCEASNTETCYCGSTLLTTEENSYCGKDQNSNPRIYAAKETCMQGSAITGYSNITVKVYDNATNNAIQFASVTIDNSELSTNILGVATFLNMRKTSGKITITASGYSIKIIDYNNRAGNIEITVKLDSSSLTECVLGQHELCANNTEGCLMWKVCVNGRWGQCQKADSLCPKIGSYCGDGHRDQPNLDKLFMEECDGSDNYECGGHVCNPDCKCSQTSVCGNNIVESDEECDGFDLLGCGAFPVNPSNPCDKQTCKCNYAPSTCGDGVLNLGEMCDYGSSTGVGACSRSQCIPKGNPGECQCIVTQKCGDLVITGTEACEKGSKYDICSNGGTCQDNCSCQTPSCPKTSYGLTSKIAMGNNNINLSWYTDCPVNLKQVMITKCENNKNSTSCTNNSAEKEYIKVNFTNTPYTYDSTVPFSYADNNIKANKTYCYKITTTHDNGPIPPQSINLSTQWHCVYAGDSECIDNPNDEFCYANTRMHCNDKNKFEPVNDGTSYANCSKYTTSTTTYTCQGPFTSTKKTTCTAVSNCNGCNGLFGSFTINSLLNLNSVMVSCMNIPNVCYKDYSETNVDMYQSCSSTKSCYDYFSKTNCEANPCGASDVKGCEWIPYTRFDELNLGVCRPKNTDLQSCSRCEEEQHNGLLLNCNPETCLLYSNRTGQKCYYNNDQFGEAPSESLYGGCIGDELIACEYYDTKQECVGNTTGVIVNTQWTLANPSKGIMNSYMSSGTNQITQISNDYYKIGLCKWVATNSTNTNIGYCLKDADNQINQNATAGINSLDCQASEGAYCFTDFMPPKTEIFTKPSMSGIQNLDYSVSDNKYAKERTTTYYCLIKQGETYIDNRGRVQPKTCYPNITTEVYGNKVYFNIKVQGNYDLYYFSVDPSSNLEVVKNTSIYIDPIAPDVKLSWNYTSTEPDPINYPDLWKSNLTFTIRILNEKATCNGKLLKLTEGGNSVEVLPDLSIKNIYSDFWNITYTFVDDGYYSYTMVCADDVGNVNQNQTYPIIIDADRSIHDPQPSITLRNKNNVTISVKTKAEASCRFSTTLATINYSKMNDTFNSDFTKTFHNKILTINQVKEGVNIINVQCNITNSKGEKVIVGNSADRIIYAIDTYPPRTEIRMTGSNQKPDLTKWYKKLEVEIYCNDSYTDPPYTYPDYNDDLGRNWEFGCEGEKAALYLGQSKDALYKQLTTTLERSYSITGIYSLYTYSVDSGGNAENTTQPQYIIQIDNDQAGAELIFKNSITQQTTTTLTYGLYDVELSTKKIGKDFGDNPPRAYFMLSKNGKKVEIENWYKYDSELWIGQVQILKTNPTFDDLEEQVIVLVNTTDYHGLQILSEQISGTKIKIDTKSPNKPILEPYFYAQAEGVEAYYAPNGVYKDKVGLYNGTFYTNQPHIYLTGKTDIYPQKIYAYYINSLAAREIPKTTYDQNDNAKNSLLKNSTIVLSEPAQKGTLDIIFSGDLTMKPDQFSAGKYIYFTDNPRKSYGNYKKYYKIKNVQRIGSKIPSDQTRVTLESSLESNLMAGQKIEVYDKETPSNWFGHNISLTPLNRFNIYLISEDEAQNQARSDDIWIVYDPYEPKLVMSKLYPGSGVITPINDQPLTLEMLEQGSKFDSTDIHLTINDIEKQINLTQCKSETYDDCYYITYKPATLDGKWTKGVYAAKIIAYDLARNKLEYKWNFTIDPDSPPIPEFSLVNSSYFEKDPITDRWIDQNTPKLRFKYDDDLVISIIKLSIYEDDTQYINVITTCVKTAFNDYTCTFPSGGIGMNKNYKVKVDARKYLTNKTRDGSAEFYFGTDNEVPNYVMEYKNVTHTKGNNAIHIKSKVTNEKNSLKAYMALDLKSDYMIPVPGSFSKKEMTYLYTIPHTFSIYPGDDLEAGWYNFTFTLIDYAGNNKSTPGRLLIDNQDPEIIITNITIDSKRIYCYSGDKDKCVDINQKEAETGADIRLSSNQIRIVGHQNYNSSKIGYDIEQIAIMVVASVSGNTSNSLEPRYFKKCSFETVNCFNNANGTFSFTIPLIAILNAETPTEIWFNITDTADNLVERKLKIINDLKIPDEPGVKLGTITN